MSVTIHESTLRQAEDVGRGGRRFGYARVSTDDQHPEIQFEILRDQAGIDPELIYVDKGEKGDDKNRPAWLRLLAEIKPGDTLVVVRLDRAFRSVRHMLEIVEGFNERKIGFTLWGTIIDTTSPYGMLLLIFLGAMAQFELMLIRSRTNDAIEKIRNGDSLRKAMCIGVGKPPVLGYANGPDGEWVTDEKMSAILIDIGRRILRGEHDGVIGKILAEHYPDLTDAYGRKIDRIAINRAFLRPATAGYMPTRNRGTRQYWQPGEPLRQVIDNPPVPYELWRKVRYRVQLRKRGPATGIGKYPLGPILRCGECNNMLTGKKTGAGNVPSYTCENPHPKLTGGRPPCRSTIIEADAVHKLVRAAVDAWAEESDEARQASGQTGELDARRAEAVAELHGAERRLAEVIENQAYIRPPSKYAAMRDQFKADIDEAEAVLAALEDEAANPAPAELDWAGMTGADFRRWAELALVTPIEVAPGRYKRLPARRRVALAPREDAA
jgi:DNA invertase Pin-like site-specific DNA recombinase